MTRTNMAQATQHHDHAAEDRPEVLPGMRPTPGLYMAADSGEAAFVPNAKFLSRDCLWRADVLRDVICDTLYWYTDAMLDFFDELSARTPEECFTNRLEAFVGTCGEIGMSLPPDFEERAVRRARRSFCDRAHGSGSIH